MELRKNKFIYALASIFAFAFIVLTLAACASSAKAEVTFMTQDLDLEYYEYKNVSVTNKKVEMPEDPTLSYYTFSGWYNDKECSAESEFKNENITESKVVYAKFVPVEVDVYINGVKEGTKELITVVNGTYNPGEGLTFDGWYTNQNYTTKWNNSDITQALYAKSVATITFNNGYEDVYETYVNPGSVYESPKTNSIKETDSSGNSVAEGSVESLKIVKNYMSTRDISYTDVEGNEFDFTKAIEKNTTITVNWRSPLLKYQKNSETGNLVVTQYTSGNTYLDDSESKYVDETGKTVGKDITNFPAISILSKITYDMNEDGIAEEYNVEAVNINNSNFLSSSNGSSIKTLIIGEGIKSIQGINGDNPTTLEDVSLPSSLKVIQNCFNNCAKLKGIIIPDGVEAIIGSFFAETNASYNSWAALNKGKNYKFNIAIPESVVNLSMVPSNLTFSQTKASAKDKDFYKDGNYIYQKDGDNLILIADFTDGDIISVPEGVNGIQVGTYFNKNIKELYLPSTFSYVNYNLNASNHKYVLFQYASNTALYVDGYEDSPLSTEYGAHSNKLPAIAFSIFNKLEGCDVLVFNTKQSPKNLSKYAILGDETGWAAYMESCYEPYTSTSFENKVIYAGESDSPIVSIAYTNSSNNYTAKLSINKDKNTALTYDEIFDAVDNLTGQNIKALYDEGKIKVDSFTSFAKDYDINTLVTTNAYLTLKVSYQETSSTTYPVTFEKVENGAKVTGFNKEGAIKGEDGKYVVFIPSSVVIDGETLNVVEIADAAFKSNSEVGVIIVPNTLKVIGSEAFMNAANLTVVDLSNATLKSIGQSAFEGAAITSLTLALSELESVGAYAFKSKSLIYFNPVESEASRDITKKSDLKEGDFFFSYDEIWISNTSSVTYATGLYQYKSKTENSDGVTIYSVDFVASTNAHSINSSTKYINLGKVNNDEKYVIEYSVLEGSIYFIDSETYIYIYAVALFKENAVTDISKITRIYYTTYFCETRYRKLSDLVNAKASVFSAFWLEDIAESDYAKILSTQQKIN